MLETNEKISLRKKKQKVCKEIEDMKNQMVILELKN